MSDIQDKKDQQLQESQLPESSESQRAHGASAQLAKNLALPVLSDASLQKRAELDAPKTEVDQTLAATRGETVAQIEQAVPATERVVQELQEEGKLPPSPHAQMLAGMLAYLQRSGINVRVDGDRVASEKPAHPVLDLPVSSLKRFLTRAAPAGLAASLLCLPSGAMAASLQPGVEIIQKAVENSPPGDSVFHYESIILILAALGVTTIVAKKIYKKLKKTPEQKAAKKKFEELQQAKASGDQARIEAATKDVMVPLMGDLPAEMEKAQETVKDIPDEDFKKALEWQKKVSEGISEILQSIQKEMVLPKKKTLENLDKLKEKVVNLFNIAFKTIEGLMTAIGKELKELQKDPDSHAFLINQLNVELKKLKFIEHYLELLLKKWLILIQEEKNKLIASGKATSSKEEDLTYKEIHALKKQLSGLLDEQASKSEPEFNAELQAAEAHLDEAIEKAQRQHLPGFEKESETEVVDMNLITLLHNGSYDHTTGIEYKINETPQKHIDITNPKVGVQIWVNEENEIYLNFNFDKHLLEAKKLYVKVDTSGTEPQYDFYIEGTDQSLADYIKEKEQELSAGGESEAKKKTQEVPSEAVDVISGLAQTVKQVRESIHDGTYKSLGRKIEADDEAIEYHLMRVHREFVNGKPQTVVRFSLSESQWKSSLKHLQSQTGVPKHSVSFNYEGSSGHKQNVNIPMIRFNVVVGGKNVSVLIPENDHYRAVIGEVRIVFDKDKDFSEDEIAEALAVTFDKLGIQSHIKPVTPQAKQKLQAKVASIRKGSAQASGDTASIHDEYDALLAKPEEIDKLKTLGVHSVYHQFSDDNLEAIFKSGQAFCTSTRWSKGIFKGGMSPTEDLVKGGATEMFTRMHLKSSLGSWYNEKPALVFPVKFLQRLDCYCYATDQYGSKMPGVFNQRISPEQLAKQLQSYYVTNHEIMFRDALPVAQAAYLVVSDPGSYIKRLEAIGVTQIGGRPLKEAVITRSKFASINNAI